MPFDLAKYFPNPFRTKAPRPDLTERMPSKTVTAMNSLFTGLPNPDEVLRYQASGKGYQLYLDMPKKDPDLAGIIRQRSLGVAAKTWEVQPFDDSPESEDIAAFVDENLNRIPEFTEIRQRLAEAFWPGLSIAEIIWQINEGGFVTIADIRDRHLNRFRFSQDGILQYRATAISQVYQDVPPMKFLTVKHNTRGENPYGTAVAQSCYLYWWIKLDGGIKNWAIATEKYAMPTPHVTYTSSVNDEEKERLISAAESIMADNSFVTSNNVEIKLLEAMRQGAPYEVLIRYIIEAYGRAILGQSKTTSASKFGTRGDTVVGQDLQDDIVQADAEKVAATIQQAIDWLVDFNFPNAAGKPRFWINYEPQKDRKVMVDVITGATNLGVPVPVSYAQEELGIPIPVDNEPILTPTTPKMPDPNDPNSNPNDQPNNDTNNLSFSAPIGQVMAIVEKLVDSSREKNSLIMATSGERITTLAQQPTSEAADDLAGSEIHNSKAVVRLAAENPESYLPGLPPVKEPVDGQPVAKQPSAAERRYQLDAIATYQNDIRRELRSIYNGFVRSILSEFGQLPGEASAAAQTENMMAVIDDFIAKEFRTKLQGGVSRANRTLIRQAARDIASKLGTSFNTSIYESLVSSYLRVHAFERMSPNSLSPVIESMIDDTRRRFSEKVSQSIASGGDLNDSITFLKTELNGIADYKATQIAVTETRAAANWAVLESGIRSGLDLEAWFIVDPESCVICQERASRNPFSMRQAQQEGLPHVQCNDYFLLTKRGAA